MPSENLEDLVQDARQMNMCGSKTINEYCHYYRVQCSEQPILGLTLGWFRELSFSRLECGVHDRLHIYSVWDLLSFADDIVLCSTRREHIERKLEEWRIAMEE